MPLWANRLAKTLIVVGGLCTVGATGWLAGSGAATPQAPPDRLPAPDLSAQVITVGKDDIVSHLTVDAVVRPDPTVPVRPERKGTVTAVYGEPGQRVDKGDQLLAISSKADPPRRRTGTAQVSAASTPVLTIVRATESGRITEVDAQVGQQVTPSATVASVEPEEFQAIGTVPPDQIYRLYTRPKSIKLAIDHGPAPFPCTLIDYGLSAAENSSDVQVRCRVPADRKVFPGVRAEMAITTDSVKKAVVVPISAVLGDAETGQVTVVKPDGAHEARTVVLGINDGRRVQVIGGLKAGDKILDRAPEDPAFTAPPTPTPSASTP